MGGRKGRKGRDRGGIKPCYAVQAIPPQAQDRLVDTAYTKPSSPVSKEIVPRPNLKDLSTKLSMCVQPRQIGSQCDVAHSCRADRCRFSFCVQA